MEKDVPAGWQNIQRESVNLESATRNSQQTVNRLAVDFVTGTVHIVCANPDASCVCAEVIGDQ